MEMAFVASSRLQTELNAQSSIRGKIVAALSNRPQLFIASMLVGNNLALVICGIESGCVDQPLVVLGSLDGKKRPSLSPFWPHKPASPQRCFGLAEFMPKSLFHASPNVWLHVMAYPLLLMVLVLAAPAWVVMMVSKGLLRPFVRGQIEVSVETLGVSDLDHFVKGLSGRMAPEQELEHELQILKNALDLPSVQARDSMVPRNEVSGIDIETTVEDLQHAFTETGFSKLVVFKGDMDHIVGTSTPKTLDRPDSLKSILLPTFVVPEPMPGDELLRQFLKRRRHLAVVVDEFGGTAGILTMEDIVEELLGEIEDEHDDPEEDMEYMVEEVSWHIPARREIRVLNELHGWNLPEADAYDTLGGLLLHEVGDIPDEGAAVTVPPFEFVVREVAEKPNCVGGICTRRRRVTA